MSQFIILHYCRRHSSEVHYGMGYIFLSEVSDSSTEYTFVLIGTKSYRSTRSVEQKPARQR